MFNVKGSIVALVTPFHEDGSVNFDKLKENSGMACGERNGWYSGSGYNRGIQHHDA